jgi:hypothetical protein
LPVTSSYSLRTLISSQTYGVLLNESLWTGNPTFLQTSSIRGPSLPSHLESPTTTFDLRILAVRGARTLSPAPPLSPHDVLVVTPDILSTVLRIPGVSEASAANFDDIVQDKDSRTYLGSPWPESSALRNSSFSAAERASNATVPSLGCLERGRPGPESEQISTGCPLGLKTEQWSALLAKPRID